MGDMPRAVSGKAHPPSAAAHDRAAHHRKAADDDGPATNDVEGHPRCAGEEALAASLARAAGALPHDPGPAGPRAPEDPSAARPRARGRSRRGRATVPLLAGLGPGAGRLLGESRTIERLRRQVAALAEGDATVLLTGPTGAGKDLVAQAIHAASARQGQAYEAVNCGAIPANLAEAELFGAEAGAYTGAPKRRIGRIEAASGGTLLLDEVGELPLDIQVKLLRVLENREVTRLGGGRPVPIDVRVIAATNRDLEAMVGEGRFRADLYWRLAVVWLEVPSLAARIEDVPTLFEHFSEGRIALRPCGLARLMQHGWPGNVRELRNFVERAMALGEHDLTADEVESLLHPRRRPVERWLDEQAAPPPPPPDPLPAQQAPAPLPGAPLLADGGRPLALKELLAQAEAAIIQQALAAGGGTVAQSARLLGLKRTTLVEKMRRMGLSVADAAGG